MRKQIRQRIINNLRLKVNFWKLQLGKNGQMTKMLVWNVGIITEIV